MCAETHNEGKRPPQTGLENRVTPTVETPCTNEASPVFAPPQTWGQEAPPGGDMYPIFNPSRHTSSDAVVVFATPKTSWTREGFAAPLDGPLSDAPKGGRV